MDDKKTRKIRLFELYAIILSAISFAALWIFSYFWNLNFWYYSFIYLFVILLIVLVSVSRKGEGTRSLGIIFSVLIFVLTSISLVYSYIQNEKISTNIYTASSISGIELENDELLYLTDEEKDPYLYMSFLLPGSETRNSQYYHFLALPIPSNKPWVKTFESNIASLILPDYLETYNDAGWSLFYNATLDEYNIYPSDAGYYDLTFVFVNTETGVLQYLSYTLYLG